MTIPTLIVSKNRACQLRLLLESLYFNATGVFQPHVVWKSTTSEFEIGYEKVAAEFPQAIFTRETYLLVDFYHFLKKHQAGHFALFMDDCIFFKPLRVSPEELISKMDNDTWCLSLRLGNNTTENTEKPITPTSEDGDFIKYKFKEYSPHDNYGFCFSWDGIVYKTQDVLDLFDDNDFTKTTNQWAILPQKIENFTQNNRDKISKNLICCPKQSHVVSMNYNTTHSAGDNYHPVDQLNLRYINGQIIDFNSINFEDIDGTHAYRGFSMRQQQT